MTKLFTKVYSVLNGECFRQRTQRRAEKLAEQRRAEQERERERVAAAAREAAERLARIKEERRRELAEREAQQRAAAAAEKEAAEQKIASMKAYLEWQGQISHRDAKESIKAKMAAPDKIPHTTQDGHWNYSNRGFFGGWHRTPKGWRKG